MKKLLSLVLVVVLVALVCVSCGAEKPNPTGDSEGVDMTQFPAQLADWSATDYNNYFKAIGLYTNDDYVYLQDHATYWPDTDVNECSGYMDNDGLYFTGVFVFDKTEGEIYQSVVASHAFPADFGSLPIDHYAANAAFFYSFTVDEDFYNAFDAAITELFTKMNVTPEF